MTGRQSATGGRSSSDGCCDTSQLRELSTTPPTGGRKKRRVEARAGEDSGSRGQLLDPGLGARVLPDMAPG